MTDYQTVVRVPIRNSTSGWVWYGLLWCVDGSARWNLQEGNDIGSMATAEVKAAELAQWTEEMGEPLSRKAFGEQGHDLHASLAEMEQWLGPPLEQLAAGFLHKSFTARGARLPTVLSKEEVRRLFTAMPEKGAHRLIVELLYGTGMRISECCQLRVCDLDFDRGEIVIRGGKGNKDRITMLPQSLEGG